MGDLPLCAVSSSRASIFPAGALLVCLFAVIIYSFIYLGWGGEVELPASPLGARSASRNSVDGLCVRPHLHDGQLEGEVSPPAPGPSGRKAISRVWRHMSDFKLFARLAGSVCSGPLTVVVHFSAALSLHVRPLPKPRTMRWAETSPHPSRVPPRAHLDNTGADKPQL